MGNTPGSYQQNEKSYKMFPGNQTSLSVPSHSLEATPRRRFARSSRRNEGFLFGRGGGGGVFFCPFHCFVLKSRADETLSNIVFLIDFLLVHLFDRVSE